MPNQFESLFDPTNDHMFTVEAALRAFESVIVDTVPNHLSMQKKFVDCEKCDTIDTYQANNTKGNI